ncbi:hypothetical protein NicSoilB4_09460 [Arthrobacter sp. NicSoilB4]|nr:hypothetical protein NicSoilB4_09460 [Arthrobacter sp. NicSoilB4]
MGVVWVAPLQPLRTVRVTEWCVVRCGGAEGLVISVTLFGPCYSPFGAKNAVASRQNVAIG